MQKASKYLIYALREPETQEVRYIGKSSIGLSRPRSHWSKACLDDGYPVHSWTRSLINVGKKPDVLILREFPQLDIADLKSKNEMLSIAEIEEIALHRSSGHRLLNMTDGGDGLLGWSGEKHPMFGRRGNLSPRFGKRHTAESKKKMSEALSGRNHPMFGKSPSFSTRKKIGNSNRGKKNGQFGKSPSNKGVSMSESQKKILREKCGQSVQCINDGKIFLSQVEAGKYYGISRNTVGHSCNNKIKSTVSGLRFRRISK